MLQSLAAIAPDPLFGLQTEFEKNHHPQKINLGIGIYFNDDGTPFVMPSVAKAMAMVDTNTNNYIAMRGDDQFLNTFEKMIFGNNAYASAQTVGGTHGVWVVGELLRRAGVLGPVIIGTPTWSNHYALLKGASFTRVDHLLWKDGIPFFAHQNYIAALQQSPQGSALLLHGGLTHNPTGLNASLSELDEIIALANEKNIFLIVDYAYFGMGNGFEADQYYATKVMHQANQAAMIFSFSKNATLYRHRLGVVFIKDIHGNTSIINQNLENIIRESISNPPAFGAMVMQRIFTTFREEWTHDLESLRNSLEYRKNQCAQQLGSSFAHIKNAKGMFTLLRISPEEVRRLKQEHAIFLPDSGRINFGGLFPNDITRVAHAITMIKNTK